MRAVAAVLAVSGALALAAPSRLELIQQRGYLGCGVEPAVPGFSEVDASGRYRGLDIDICRAIAAAIFGTADKVKFIAAPSIAEFLRHDELDIVSRRLTWELRREGASGLLFGPITFYDGQGILVAKSAQIFGASGFRSVPICVAGGVPWELQLNNYTRERNITIQKTVLESAHDYQDIAARLNDRRCRAYTGDLSDLGAIRSKLARPDTFAILPERLSKEPRAPVVRDDDPQFFAIVRWTIFALINAEELGITSVNIEVLRREPLAEGSLLDPRSRLDVERSRPDVQRLLGVQPGNGKALGLDELWAYHAIKAVGNYGEMFERNLGTRSAIKLERGLNRLWTRGGLIYAPPLR